jgi:hypothetical protein
VAKKPKLSGKAIREKIIERKLIASSPTLSRLPRTTCLKCGKKLEDPLTSETNHGPASWCGVCRRLIGIVGAGSQPLTATQREEAGLEPSYHTRQSKERIPYSRRVETWYEVPTDPRKALRRTIGRVFG